MHWISTSVDDGSPCFSLLFVGIISSICFASSPPLPRLLAFLTHWLRRLNIKEKKEKWVSHKMLPSPGRSNWNQRHLHYLIHLWRLSHCLIFNRGREGQFEANSSNKFNDQRQRQRRNKWKGNFQNWLFSLQFPRASSVQVLPGSLAFQRGFWHRLNVEILQIKHPTTDTYCQSFVASLPSLLDWFYWRSLFSGYLLFKK